LPGFKQYDELPVYYARAGAFVHVSTTEPWGLVVNEAMASGLPVLVSDRCGCASDLVREGLNGFTFDPFAVDQITASMQRIALIDDEGRTKMGRQSQRLIAQWGTERFANGLASAVRAAIAAPAPRVSFFTGLMLRLLLLR
jgi:glycosyltransferase involved in cell wall biosynthesis